jgi:uncharacterized protein
MSDEESLIEPSEDDEESPTELEIPFERLSADALLGVIEEYVTREGTEYGLNEVTLETKIAQVRRQLERGEVVVLFDARNETVNLARADERARSAKR